MTFFPSQLVLVNPVGSVLEKLYKSDALGSFGVDELYMTVSEAVYDVSSQWKPKP